jgi:hypothetical protein
MKLLDYLYYKIYRANLIGSAKDIAKYVAPSYLGGLIFLNLLAIGSFLRKLDLLPFFFKSTIQVVIFMICLFGIISILFLYRKRYKTIIAKYEMESEKNRKRGNLFVWIYVVVSFLLIFAVAFYKPGKL